MSDEYTPTTAGARKAWVSYRLDYGWFKNENVGRGAAAIEAEFDRWLAEHDREVAAKALEDAERQIVHLLAEIDYLVGTNE